MIYIKQIKILITMNFFLVIEDKGDKTITARVLHTCTCRRYTLIAKVIYHWQCISRVEALTAYM